ncbi:MAG: preprotein translocase subunit SecA [Candidatus Babeliales bacterium]
MIGNLLSRLLGTSSMRQVRKLEPLVRHINDFEPAMQALSPAAMIEKTNEFRQRITRGQSLDDILPEAFALVREAAHRQLGQRHFDVQLIGGIVLHQGKIAEMKTGEGKTLTATLPLYLNALAGNGAHLVTVNDYLARRDAAWMGQIFGYLGLTVGCLQHTMSDIERARVYQTDILYATNNELGFDYLRDNMKFRLEDYVQKELAYAIVDEVDSILIDEARTPLIISGASDEGSRLYQDVNRVIPRLVEKDDYEVDEKQRTVQLTENGNDKIESMLNVQNLYDIQHLNLLHHVHQALRAHALFKRDVDYVVKDNEVLIVDEFTGRILSGRRYSDGLHQAIEAKEGVKVERESQTLASITLQNFFRLYKKLAGMTGTALTEAEEFYKVYNLDVVSIPTNRPMIRVDQDDAIFFTKRAKYKAIVEDVKERHQKGQPVLIGTIAIETSELLSDILRADRIPHEVLNAKQHEREADIVALAGQPGHVTIATNMAGRGTDIKLASTALDAGGLYIIGTERHESRRIDNQLRGRSGRQGDPGESRFYISMDDDLVRVFAGPDLKDKMAKAGMTEEDRIEHKFISRAIEHAQERVEKHYFEMRKHALEYDDVLNQQRNVIYRYRREVLEGSQQSAELFADMIATSIEDLVGSLIPDRSVTEDAYALVLQAVSDMTGIAKELIAKENPSRASVEALVTDLINILQINYKTRANGAASETIEQAEKWLMLETIDQAWKQHMLNLDNLKEGIGLRGWGQKNPLIEYKKEAFFMFQEMMRAIRFEMVHRIFNLDIARFNQDELERRRQDELDELNLIASGSSEAAPEPVVRSDADRVGRNDPCPCGSGKKHKKCCMK